MGMESSLLQLCRSAGGSAPRYSAAARTNSAGVDREPMRLEVALAFVADALAFVPERIFAGPALPVRKSILSTPL